MKIAVKNIDGIQADELLKLRFYYVVADDYDFSGNDATDVTDVDSLWLFYKFNRIDYTLFRDSVKTNIIPNFNSLSFANRKFLVSYYLYPAGFTQADIDGYYTVPEQLRNWKVLAAISIEARKNRFKDCRQTVSFYLSLMDTADLYLSTEQYKNKYIDAQLPHLVLWITNGADANLGIDFTTNGFAQKSYFSTNLRDILTKILVQGLY